jgi:hypothetical protein
LNAEERVMFELKPISSESIPRALAKAERYRLLNEPQEAESICRDVMAADPASHEALVTLLLSITDQFAAATVGTKEAKEVLARLQDEYERSYYSGLICERWIKARLQAGAHRSMALGWFLETMDWYEKAQALAPPGNDDAVLRWNSCVRFMERNQISGSSAEPEGFDAGFGDDAPPR